MEENQSEFVSLYEYLGRPAGGDLGKQVAFEASKVGEPVEVKFVKNPKYEGPINMFHRSFLDYYFNKENNG